MKNNVCDPEHQNTYSLLANIEALESYIEVLIQLRDETNHKKKRYTKKIIKSKRKLRLFIDKYNEQLYDNSTKYSE